MAIEFLGSAPAPIVAAAETWDAYLDPDEMILWQGAPATGVRLKGRDLGICLFGCAFMAFGMFWSMMAIAYGPGDHAGALFPLFGIPFILLGALMAVGGPVLNARVRRGTRYALTDRRAIITRSAFGRSLKSYPIDADTEIDYRPGPEAVILFAREVRRSGNGEAHTYKHGFEFVLEGDKVYRLMRRVQRGDAGPNGR